VKVSVALAPSPLLVGNEHSIQRRERSGELHDPKDA
jgi:hypothetical protein